MTALAVASSPSPSRHGAARPDPKPALALWAAAAALAVALAVAPAPAAAAGNRAEADSTGLAGLPYGAMTSYLLGTMLLDRGEVAEALPYLQLAHRMAPGYFVVSGAYLQALVAAGARDEALALLDELITAAPDSARLREQRAGLLIETGRYDDALAEIARARADVGGSASLTLLEGEALARSGRVADAIAVYRTALSGAPERAAQIYLVLAGLLPRAGRESELPALWREALAASPADGRLREAALQDLVRRDQVETALELALAGDESPPGESAGGAGGPATSYVVEFGRLLVQADRADRAVAALQGLRAKGRLALAPRLWLSRLLVQKEQAEEAVSLLRETVKLWPDASDAHLHLGEALVAQQDLVGGEAELRRAYALAPHDAQTLIALVRVLAIRLGQGAPATPGGAAAADTASRRAELRDLAGRAAAAVEPEDERGHMILGFTFRSLGDAEHAAGMFGIAASQPDVRREALLQLADCQERLARLTEARTTFETLRRENPDDPTIANALGYFLAERGVELSRAEDLVREALAKDPSSPYYLDSLGWVAFQRRDYQKAFDLLVRAANGLPDSVEILEHLGLTLEALGRRDEAARTLRRALEVGGGDEARLRKALDRVTGGGGP